MNAREVFSKARRLYRRGLNEKYRTPIAYDELYTRSGRNGSYNPSGYNADCSTAFVMLHVFGPEGQCQAAALLSRYSEPQRIISVTRSLYLHEVHPMYEIVNGEKVWFMSSNKRALEQVRRDLVLRIRREGITWANNVPTPKLPK